jgi:glutamate synthase domain-containing protein 3
VFSAVNRRSFKPKTLPFKAQNLKLKAQNSKSHSPASIMPETTLAKTVIDCNEHTTRDLNQMLRGFAAEGISQAELTNPAGRHNLAVGLESSLHITFQGPVGYYCGGMCDGVTLDIYGTCGWSLGENLMSGSITVHGNASANVAASAHGGKVTVLGNTGPRAAISLKGAEVIITGNVGHSTAFMMQAGRLIICGNAGANLGDSMYNGEIFVGGAIASLGADARYEPMTDADWQSLDADLNPLGIDPHSLDFKKIICAQELYHFKAKDFSKFKDAY